MVTSETDIEELLDLVVSAANEMQESSKELRSMSELTLKAIQKAQDDLKKETDEKIWNEGLLRVVPGIGSVLNWLSPIDGTGVRGRTLNLDQGVVESTENIYRYHVFQPLQPHPEKHAQPKPTTEVSSTSIPTEKQEETQEVPATIAEGAS
jgi:hypothetical protein